MSIQSIESASKICKNDFYANGILSELSVDLVYDSNQQKVTVKYKGVIIVDETYIRFYGSVWNTSTTFKSTVNTLKNLKCELKCDAVNGEIVHHTYSHQASTVCIKGRYLSHNSVWADYIAESFVWNKQEALTCQIVGVAIDVDTIERKIKVLCINQGYHQVVTVYCDDNIKDELNNKTICCIIHQNRFAHAHPMSCSKLYRNEEQIDFDVFTSARKEHEIFQKVLKGNRYE